MKVVYTESKSKRLMDTIKGCTTFTILVIIVQGLSYCPSTLNLYNFTLLKIQ